MNDQSIISIRVPLDVAQKYQRINQVEQDKIQIKLTKIIEFEIEKYREQASQKLSELMDKASDEAQANGLTEDILESILNDE